MIDLSTSTMIVTRTCASRPTNPQVNGLIHALAPAGQNGDERALRFRRSKHVRAANQNEQRRSTRPTPWGGLPLPGRPQHREVLSLGLRTSHSKGVLTAPGGRGGGFVGPGAGVVDPLRGAVAAGVGRFASPLVTAPEPLHTLWACVGVPSAAVPSR